MRGQPGRDSAGKTVRVQERDLAVVHGWARPERWSESRYREGPYRPGCCKRLSSFLTAIR